MFKRIFIVFIIFIVASIGIYSIAVLSGKIVIPKVGKKVVEEVIQKEISETPEPKVFDFERANEITISEIREGNNIVIDKVNIEAPGFVVVYQNSDTKSVNVLGFSQLLPKGESRDISVILKRPVKNGETIYLGLRIDDGDKFFEFTGRYDKNIQRADGKAILQKFIVSGLE